MLFNSCFAATMSTLTNHLPLHLLQDAFFYYCLFFNTQGISQACNAAGRKPRHLYILPGGVAEIFTSTPGRHTIVFKKRRGLVRLSIETGAQLVPCYVFGGTDFFHNLATDAGFFARLSRMCRAGVTIFWGRFGLPIPFCPRVSFIFIICIK